MSFDRWPWGVLGLKQPIYNKRDIKRAYAKRLKQIDQQKEIQAFTELREAYDFALYLCKDAPAEESSATEQGKKETASLQSAEDTDTSAVSDIILEKETPRFIELVIKKPKPVITSGLELEKQEEVYAADDWDYLLGLSHKIFDLIRHGKDPYDIEAWKTILDDPALMSFSAKRYIEEQVFRAVLEQTSYKKDNEDPVTPPGITPEFIALLDHYFGWISDGLTFTKNYGEAGDWVSRALSKRNLQKFYAEDQEHLSAQTSQAHGALPWWIIILIFLIGTQMMRAIGDLLQQN